MPRSRKSKHSGLKTCRNHNRNHKRQRGGELTPMSKYAYNEDAFDAIKQDFLDLIEINVEYLNKDVFFDKIKTKIKSLSTDNAFLTELDTLMKAINYNNNNAVNDAEYEVMDHIAMHSGETIIEIAAIVLLGDESDPERLYRKDSDVRRFVFEYMSSLPEFNQRRVEQRQNAFVGLQGQGGLPANVAGKVMSYL
jgi:hypothetical protein